MTTKVCEPWCGVRDCGNPSHERTDGPCYGYGQSVCFCTYPCMEARRPLHPDSGEPPPEFGFVEAMRIVGAGGEVEVVGESLPGAKGIRLESKEDGGTVFVWSDGYPVTLNTSLMEARFRLKPAPAPVSRVEAIVREVFGQTPPVDAVRAAQRSVREVLDEVDKHMEENSYLPHGDARRLVSEARARFLGGEGK